jgi:hypothetical protein
MKNLILNWFILFVFTLFNGLSCEIFAQKEREQVLFVPKTSYAVCVNSEWLEICLVNNKYDTSFVTKIENFNITSSNDVDFLTSVNPSLVQFRYRAEEAPFNQLNTGKDIGTINVFYRIFLKMPEGKKFKEGSSYSISINSVIGNAGPLNFKFDISKTNWAIHSNQVGYRPENIKLAYLDMWTGQGFVDFSISSTFQIIDENSSLSVFNGEIKLSSANNRWTFSNIYSMDFSEFKTPGRYHIYVPGVGISYPFSIDENIYKDAIAFTSVRGLFMQRDGAHGLDNTALTYWNRPPAHMDDAIDENSGQRVDLTGGHMDAGDRGKYPYNSSEMSSSLLTGALLFPEQIEILGESLEIPESNNAIPDYLDELVYELDWIYKTIMNTSTDGTLCAFLRPSNKGYEQGQPPEGATGRIFFNKTAGPNIIETLYAAGTLATAFNTPIMQQYFPDKCAEYLVAAEKAYNGFKIRRAAGTIREDEYYDSLKKTALGTPHSWSAEMLYCASALLQATGNNVEYFHWIEDEMPLNPDDYDASKVWGWVTSGSPWNYAFTSIFYNSNPSITDATKRWAFNGIVNYANAEIKHQTPFGAPTQDEGYANSIGWHFVMTKIAPVVMGYGVTGNAAYLDFIQRTWNYMLGTNAASKPFITGLGDPQRTDRWFVHELWQVEYSLHKQSNEGWVEPPPGIPTSDLQVYGWPYWFNDDAKYELFPAPHSVMYSFMDCWKVENEFGITDIAKQSLAVLPMLKDIENYMLTEITVNGKLSLPGGLYVAGSEIILTAIPNPGTKFLNWNGDQNDTINFKKLTIDSDKTITANFSEPPYYTITTSATYGTIIIDPLLDKYPMGTEVTVTAIPDQGYYLSSWSGDLSGIVNTVTMVMNYNKSVTATFKKGEIPPELINLAQMGTGRHVIYKVDHFGNAFTLMTDGEKISTISEDSWANVKKTEDFWGIAFDRDYYMNKVVFTNGKIFDDGGWFAGDLKVQVRQNGEWVNVTGSNVSPEYPYNETAGPNKDYTFTFDDTWGDAVRVYGIPGGSSTFTSVGEFEIYSNTTDLVRFTLSASSINGTIIIEPDSLSYLSRTSVVLTAVPDNGFEWVNWGGDITDNTNPVSLTMNNNKVITANFKLFTSIFDKSKSSEEFLIVPNPIENHDLKIKLPDGISGKVTVKIYNMSGQLLYENIFVTQKNIKVNNLNSLVNGIYFVNISNGYKTLNSKFVIK